MTSEAKAAFILREARDEGRGVFFSSPRLAVCAKFCVRHAWLLNRLLRKLTRALLKAAATTIFKKHKKFKYPHAFFFFLRNPTKGIQKYNNNFNGAVFTRSNVLASTS